MYDLIEPKYEYKEIHRLSKMLDDAGIPYEKQPSFGGYIVCYPCYSPEERICDAIEHNGSYGREADKLEMMGLLTNEELKFDSVKGYVTAEEVFERIKKNWEEKENA